MGGTCVSRDKFGVGNLVIDYPFGLIGEMYFRLDRSQFPQSSECVVSPVVRNFPDQQCGKNTTCFSFAGSGKSPARMSGNTQGALRRVFPRSTQPGDALVTNIPGNV